MSKTRARQPSRAVMAAVADLSAAKKQLADARRKLARLTAPGHPAHLVDPEWAWAAELLEARSPALLAHPGVVGVGLGFRMRGGAPTGEPCLTVYVRRKLSERALAKAGRRRLPKVVRSGRKRLAVDVLPLGRLRRHVQAGASLGPVGGGERGTLGTLAKDLDAGDTVALTAMHVCDMPQFPVPGSAAPRFASPIPGGTPFGTLRQGTMTGIDAAKLALDAPQPAISELPRIGRITGWRPITYPGDQGTTVRMFGAVSGFQSGYIVNPLLSLPGESLDAAVLVNIFTQAGDSGSAIVDHEALLLGFLVGQGSASLGNLRVFTPASLVFSVLRCDLPTT
jgi:hypothetical protein